MTPEASLYQTLEQIPIDKFVGTLTGHLNNTSILIIHLKATNIYVCKQG